MSKSKGWEKRFWKSREMRREEVGIVGEMRGGKGGEMRAEGKLQEGN